MSGRNRARFAGRWYASDPAHLQKEIIAAYDAARNARRHDGTPVATDSEPNAPVSPSAGGVIDGAVLPHAGHAFSGRGIAQGFLHDADGAADEAPPERVIVLSPSHYVPLSETSLYAESFAEHETPLGALNGAPDFISSLRDELGAAEVIDADAAIEREHGTEMFLPFIRHAAPDARVSLLLVPHVEDRETIQRWSAALRRVIAAEARRTRLIVSSDFTHYGARFRYTPFGAVDSGGSDVETIVEMVRRDDHAVAAMIAGRDGEALIERMRRPITVCGRHAILVGLEIFRRDGTVVDYYSSRDIAGESGGFVCYASIIFPGAEVGYE